MNKLCHKFLVIGQCIKTWVSLRQVPGLFSLSDALLSWKQLFLPLRFADRAAGKALRREARIEQTEEGFFQVSLIHHGLVFYWPGTVSNNLYYPIAQEINPRFPHYYTTPPIALSPKSLVLDVGACEGLFAFRALKQGLAGRVICFEPSQRAGACARLGARKNGFTGQITIEALAVGKASGQIQFYEGDSADGSRVDPGATSGEPRLGAARQVEMVSLDDYCAKHGIRLTAQDLIKIDAEGSDFDVLLGAEKLIRAGSPQIAVTTYHKPEHALQIATWLKTVQPKYRLRLKGFSFWTPKPTPVLLQAAL